MVLAASSLIFSGRMFSGDGSGVVVVIGGRLRRWQRWQWRG